MLPWRPQGEGFTSTTRYTLQNAATGESQSKRGAREAAAAAPSARG